MFEMIIGPGGVSDKAVFVHSDRGRSCVEGWLPQGHGLVYEDIRNPNHLCNIRVEGNECFVRMFVTVRKTQPDREHQRRRESGGGEEDLLMYGYQETREAKGIRTWQWVR